MATTSKTRSSSAKNWSKKMYLHLDSHRRVRRRNPRNQARPRGIHSRYSQREREGPAESGRNWHCSASARMSARETSWSARFRPNQRPSLRRKKNCCTRSSGGQARTSRTIRWKYPSGVEGIVIDTQRFSRRMSLSEDERKAFEKSLKAAETEGNSTIAEAFSAHGRSDPRCPGQADHR